MEHFTKSVLCLIVLSGCASVSVDLPENISSPATDVANAPLETLNLRKVEIPEYFATMTHPYQFVGKEINCEDIEKEIDRLTDFLGPDYDAMQYDGDDQDTVAGDVAKMLIPYGGPIRFLSGAKSHEKEVVRVVNLGVARRAYLKAHGEIKGCVYPAAPRD